MGIGIQQKPLGQLIVVNVSPQKMVEHSVMNLFCELVEMLQTSKDTNKTFPVGH